VGVRLVFFPPYVAIFPQLQLQWKKGQHSKAFHSSEISAPGLTKKILRLGEMP